MSLIIFLDLLLSFWHQVHAHLRSSSAVIRRRWLASCTLLTSDNWVRHTKCSARHQVCILLRRYIHPWIKYHLQLSRLMDRCSWLPWQRRWTSLTISAHSQTLRRSVVRLSMHLRSTLLRVVRRNIRWILQIGHHVGNLMGRILRHEGCLRYLLTRIHNGRWREAQG